MARQPRRPKPTLVWLRMPCSAAGRCCLNSHLWSMRLIVLHLTTVRECLRESRASHMALSSTLLKRSSLLRRTLLAAKWLGRTRKRSIQSNSSRSKATSITWSRRTRNCQYRCSILPRITSKRSVRSLRICLSSFWKSKEAKDQTCSTNFPTI